MRNLRTSSMMKQEATRICSLLCVSLRPCGRTRLFCDFLRHFEYIPGFLAIFWTIYLVCGYKLGLSGSSEAPCGYKWDQIVRVQTGFGRKDLWGDMQGSCL